MKEWQRKLILGAIVAASLGVIAASIISGSPKSAPSLKASQVSATLAGIPQSGPHLGNDSAKLEILEFIDLHCAACRASVLQDSSELISEYVRNGKARWTLAPIALIQGQDQTPLGEAYQAGTNNRMFQYVLGYYAGGQDVARGLSGVRAGQPLSAAAQVDRKAAARLASMWKIDATPTIMIHGPRGWVRLAKNHFSLQDIRSAMRGLSA